MSSFRASVLIAALAMVAAAPSAFAQASVERFRSAVAVDAHGSLLIDNPVGPIFVTGTTKPGIRWEAVKSVRGVSPAAIEEGRKQTALGIGGTLRERVLRTEIPYPLRNGRWESGVMYRVEVPSTISLTILSVSGQRVMVSGIRGPVTIKHVNGRIELKDVTGPQNVETVNGDIIAVLPATLSRDVLLSSVNGHVQVETPPGASFSWEAETLRGGILSNLKVRGFFRRAETRQYHAVIGEGTKVRVRTSTVLGDIYLLRTGSRLADAGPISPSEMQASQERVQPQPLRPDTMGAFRQVSSSLLVGKPSARSFVAQQARIEGDFRIDVPMGSIFVGEIGGDAAVATRAGEIVLGRVTGRGDLRSLGGSIHLGDVQGPLDAFTSVGDIMIRLLRRGGSAVTDGGNIQIVGSGGPLVARTGGGDVTLRQVVGGTRAETNSGDVFLNVDPLLRSARIEARSGSGNIVLNLPPGLAADIDATVLSSDARLATFSSELPGLTVTRDTVGGRQRVRATGKINGGGDRIELRSENGGIQITARPASRVTLE